MLKKHLFHLAIASFFTLTANAADANDLKGVVLETMNSGGYTYMEVDAGGARQWVAIPESTVQKGQEVLYRDGMEMKDFHSKTLGRTFSSIIFSDGLVVGDQPAAEPAEAKAQGGSSFADAVAEENLNSPHSAQPMIASAGSSGAIVPLTDIKVDKAEGENSFSVAEIFTRAKELNGKEVRVRGKVVKFSPSIMGRNWIHIQDGTGNPMQNSHDLVVTSQATVSQDSVVTLKGVLAAEKDFGAGYTYAVIVEEAIVE